MKNFSNDILANVNVYNAVATYNADPFCVETEEAIEGIKETIAKSNDVSVYTMMDEEWDELVTMLDDVEAEHIYVVRTDDPNETLTIALAGELTYDVVFNDDEKSDRKGFYLSIESAMDYIEMNNGTNESYFADYKGGIVSVVCNETGNEVYSVDVK